MFQKRAVERDVVGNAIDNDCVCRRFVEGDRSDVNELGPNSFNILRVYALHQRAGEGIFKAEQNADSFHGIFLFRRMKTMEQSP